MEVHEITSALTNVTLLPWKLRMEEELGRPFLAELEMLCEKSDVAAEKMLGTSLTVKIVAPDGSPRYVNGLVSRFWYVGLRGRYHIYAVTLRPWLWFLTRASDCRIYQEKTVPEILEDTFRTRNGFSDFKRSLTGTYRKWEYCVQYRETDFDFVSRLMEQEGIYYYFTHEQGKHTLVLADSPEAHQPIAGEGKLLYRGGGYGRIGQDHIRVWRRFQEVQSAVYVLQDYDFQKPTAGLEVRSQVRRSHALASYEQFDYPGEYLETGDGTNYAKVRIEELQSQHLRAYGEGQSYALSAGKKFQFDEFPRAAENGEYLCLSAKYDIQVGEIEQFASDSDNRFEVRFEAGDAKQTFRPRRSTPRPIISGPQTAVVVGKSGEEIWTDEFGRVKVKFHWDRLSKSDENSSCWIRVAQAWAGKNWGAVHVPRIGQEVIVEFLEGDPDRPIITGRVYNKLQTTPYTLPANATQSGIKSRSSKEGTGENFNELRFEDKKGEEEVYFHAEKNFNRVVENNDTLKVGFEKKDAGDQTIEIFNNQVLKVGNSEATDGSQTIQIWKNRTETVLEGNESITIAKGNRAVIVSKGNDAFTVSEGNREVTVSKGNDTHTVSEGNREVTVGQGNDTHTVSQGDREVTVGQGNDTHTVSQGNREVTVAQGNDTLTVSQGNLTIDVTAGKCSVTAGQEILLTVGESSIKIDSSSITLQAPQIKISGDSKVEVVSQTVKANGSMAVKIQGGIVKIN